MENIILIGLNLLPKLVNGKVALISEEGYELLKPTGSTVIRDGFNPLYYSILIHKIYPRCIVYSTEREREDYLVNVQIEGTKQFNFNKAQAKNK